MCKKNYIKVVIWKDIFMKLAICRRDEQNESSKVAGELSLHKCKSKNYVKT